MSQAEVVAGLLLSEGREATRRWVVPNTQPGAEALAQRLATLARAHHLAGLRLGLDATKLSWGHLAGLLQAPPLLDGLEREVQALTPKGVAGRKAAYSASGKTERRAAFVIAECLRIGRRPAPFQVDVLQAPLQRLTRLRAHLAQTLARAKTYVLRFLVLKVSACGTSEAFGAPCGATSVAVLEHFSTAELVQLPLEEWATFVQEHGRGRCADPDEGAATLAKAARASSRLARVRAEPVPLVRGTTRATIRTLQAPLKEGDQTLARALAAMPAVRRTSGAVPGLGPVWTAGLSAELGASERFADEEARAKEAGLGWPPHESGTFQAQDTALSKAGNASLRYQLVEAAHRVRLPCAEYRDYDSAKLAPAPTHAPKRALVLTARKLVRLVAAVLRAGAVYQPQDRKEGQTTPPAARPRPHRRARLVASAR